MGRRLYVALVRLHPRAFRERFGEEMIGILDEEARKGARLVLLLDAVTSLLRQWALRPASPSTFLAAGPAQPSDIPVFYSFESCPPRRSALVNGAILSIIFFGAVSLAIGRGGGKSPNLLIGAKYPRPLVLPVDRSSVAETEPTTEIKVPSPAVDPLYQLADVYFTIVRVLDVLDADRDRIISSWEIITAPTPLRKLDRDRDGELSAEECGFFLGNNPDPQLEELARLDFMRLNPVLAALDADGDARISAVEIKTSSVSLRALDKNSDGGLAPTEVLPDPIDSRATFVLSRLDKDRDRKISRQERMAEEAGPLQELLDRADRNGDVVVTAAELTKELRLRDELARQLQKANAQR